MFAAKADTANLVCRCRPSAQAFTLLELLIAIGIVAVLLALLGASIGGAWEVAIDVQCKHNLGQLHKALHMGRDVTLPSPLYWVGFVESVDGIEALICPKGDTSRPDPAAPPPRNPLPGNQADDAPLPPLPSDEPCPEQDIEPVRAPASVMIGQNGALESSTMIRVFCEQKNYVLPSSVQVSISGPGYYDSHAKMTPGSVAAGTRVNCYFIHFDPAAGGGQVSGRMNFNGDILGVVCRDAQLDASDSVLGNPGTQYPTGHASRGFESGQDIVSVSDDRRTLTIHRFYSTSCGEQARVIVQAKAKDDSGGSSGSGGGLRPASDLAWDGDSEGDVGGPTSYAMNARATSSDAWPGQVLLVEYRRTIADVGLGTAGAREVLLGNLAPRHDGRVNVLFVDGRVESFTPQELLPTASGEPWIGRYGLRMTP
jgi:prepilin-type processing-associated H-X9-DG protein/prepilin-type N-terminal cleavage/methylation domain-containing protein